MNGYRRFWSEYWKLQRWTLAAFAMLELDLWAISHALRWHFRAGFWDPPVIVDRILLRVPPLTFSVGLTGVVVAVGALASVVKVSPKFAWLFTTVLAGLLASWGSRAVYYAMCSLFE
jgi:hypothetical protein